MKVNLIYILELRLYYELFASFSGQFSHVHIVVLKFFLGLILICNEGKIKMVFYRISLHLSVNSDDTFEEVVYCVDYNLLMQCFIS